MSHVQNVKISKGQDMYKNEHVEILKKRIKYQLVDGGKPKGRRFPLVFELVPFPTC